MSRSLPYRLECPEKCLQAQDEALNSTFFIVRQTGPTAFVLKEDDERTYKVMKTVSSDFHPYDHHSCRYFWVTNINALVILSNVNENYANTSFGCC